MDFDLNRGNAEKTWSYSDASLAIYSPEITGTLIELAWQQTRNMHTRQPDFWEDGNPKLQVRMMILRDDAKGAGKESAWFFGVKSLAAQAVNAAMGGTGKMEALLGKRVRIATPGTTPVQTKRGMVTARAWEFQILGEGNKAAVRGVIPQPILCNQGQDPNAAYQGQQLSPQQQAMNQYEQYEKQQAVGPMAPQYAQPTQPAQPVMPASVPAAPAPDALSQAINEAATTYAELPMEIEEDPPSYM